METFGDDVTEFVSARMTDRRDEDKNFIHGCNDLLV
jgi:hypothetical protein